MNNQELDQEEGEKSDTRSFLPSEVIIEILKYLEIKDLKNVSLVSRMWFCSTLTDTLWKFYYCVYYPLPDPITEEMLNRKQNAVKVLSGQFRDSESPFFCEFGVGVWRRRFMNRFHFQRNFRLGNVTKTSTIFSQNIDDRLMSFGCTNDEKYLIVGTEKGFVSGFEMKSNFRKVLNLRCHRDHIRSLNLFLHEGLEYILTISELDHNTIQLRELTRSKNKLELKIIAKKPCRGTHTWFRCVEVVKPNKNSTSSGEGKFPIIISGEFKSIVFNRVNFKKQQIQSYRNLRDAHRKVIRSLLVFEHTNGKQLMISTSDDGFVYLWDIFKEKIIRSLLPHETFNIISISLLSRDHNQQKIQFLGMSPRIPKHDSKILFLETSLEEGEPNVMKCNSLLCEGHFKDRETVCCFCVWPAENKKNRILICGTELGNLYVFKIEHSSYRGRRRVRSNNSEKMVAKLLWKKRIDEHGGMVRKIRVISGFIFCSVDRPIRPTHTVKRSTRESRSSKILVMKFNFRKKENLLLVKKTI